MILNKYVDQNALSLYVIMYEFYKLVVEELFFRLGEIVFGTDMVGKTPIAYCDVSFKTTKSIQTKESRNGATGLRFYKPTSLMYQAKPWTEEER